MKDFGSWSTSWTSPWYGWMGRLGILELGWRVSQQGLPFLGSRRSLWEPLTVPCLLQVGFVNSLKFSAAGDFLVAGIGQEHRYCPPSLVLPGNAASPSSGSCWRVIPLISLIHRLGRWWRIKEAKNSICIIPLKQKTTAPSPESPGSS